MKHTTDNVMFIFWMVQELSNFDKALFSFKDIPNNSKSLCFIYALTKYLS